MVGARVQVEQAGSCAHAGESEQNQGAAGVIHSEVVGQTPPPSLSFWSLDQVGLRTVNFESSRVVNLHFVYQITYQSQNDS